MRRAMLLGLAASVVFGLVSPAGATGNGAPNGAHYTLNIIGVPKNKTATMTDTSGRSLFVPLQGGCKINLQPGAFDVIDRNCTDDGVALFQLPVPDPTNSGTTTYSVWARALGTPGGSSTTTTCFTDTTTNQTFCSVFQMVLVRSTGKSTFQNVSKELLYVYYCNTATGKVVRVPLFDSTTDNFFWQYDNNGLKLAQLRFYPVPTTVVSAGQSC